VLEFLSSDIAMWILFAVAGVVAGVINTLAGSGSLVTLPIFMFVCGLPPNIANGTNRVGVIFQTVVGIRGFRESGTDYRGSAWLVVPAVIGALLGAWLASEMSAGQMRYVIGGLMVVMLFVLLVNPKRWIQESDSSNRNNAGWLSIGIYFLIGIYGGFIQAGVGIFLLAAAVLVSRYSLKDGNAIKLLVILAFAIPTLGIFCWHNQVHFGYGIAMAVFQSIGAVLGVRFATRVPDANLWIHRLLIVILIAAATKIFLF
jgi:uncharacterized membrane protein YfcA